MKKELCLNTDFLGDLANAGRLYDRRDIDGMMKYAASLGATRYEWILGNIFGMYEDYPGGFDLLKEVCDAAHRHGLRFYPVFKPFEGGGTATWMGVVPHTFPRLEGVPLLEEQEALVHAVRPFVAAHPEMRLARRPHDAVDPGGRIAAIRLIKGDDGPIGFDPRDISIWTSSCNGGFERYEGPRSLSESVEWRPVFPYRDSPCRLLTFGDLDLPESARYVLVRVQKRNDAGTFTNELHSLVELINESGDVIPSTPSVIHLRAEQTFERMSTIARLGVSRYARRPEVRELLQDRDRGLPLYREMYQFSLQCGPTTFDRIGEVAIARGKPRYVTGAMHPAHPEVRKDWLDHVRFCIDRGADGVNMRIANHNRPNEPWAYGFNEPVLERTEHPDNVAEAARINGEAYTQFLREAQDLLHGNGREMGVHVHGLMFRHDDRAADSSPLPRNFDWQWELWVRELADYVEFRGANHLRPENIREAADRIGLAAREAGIPFIYQSTRSEAVVHFHGPYPTLEREMAWVRGHPDITGYNLYETHGFTRVNAGGEFEGSPDIAELVRRHWRE